MSAYQTSRRNFLASSTTCVAGAAVLGCMDTVRAASGNRFRIGLIGCGGQGVNVLKAIASREDVAVAYLCDADLRRQEVAARALAEVTQTAPKLEVDLRRVLDDKNVDAVIIATPDHWHAPATILACEAGKHIYVEKPCAHNIREGRLMIEAARANKRIVQVGTQSRSAPYIAEAMKLLADGAIGKVMVAKAWNSQKRADIGRSNPTDPPQEVDYDLWVGPAPMTPFQSNRFNPVWRWWYSFGTGDMGNDGVHELDIARWGLGVSTHPSYIAAGGGKYAFNDDQQFPDTQYVVFEYAAAGNPPSRQLIYEQRLWAPYVQEGFENGNAFYGTEGMLILGKARGWQLFGPRNKLIQERSGTVSIPDHFQNFVDAIRSGELPSADIEIGHLSAGLAHLGNIAVRVGRSLRFDAAKEQVLNDPEANALVRRSYREGHWAVPKNI